MPAEVGILVGSESDRERMQPALDALDERGVAYEFEVRSAHRTPDAVAEYARTARERGIRVLICGAGLSAALPGVVAAHTDLPVIGVPFRSSLSVLDVVGAGETVEDARTAAYAGLAHIDFAGMQYRSDIAG